MPTTNLGLPLIAGNMTANVPRDMNALAEEIDLKVAGKQEIVDVSNALTTHLADSVKHITGSERNKWNNAVNAISTEIETDPDTTNSPYILSSHANGPMPPTYFHIRTYWYANKGSNKAQIAVSYNSPTKKAIMFIREFYNSWGPWVRLIDENLKNVANGYAGLDGNAKVPLSILPPEVVNVATGTYVGSSNAPNSSRFINIGFTPRLILIFTKTNNPNSNPAMGILNNEGYKYLRFSTGSGSLSSSSGIQYTTPGGFIVGDSGTNTSFDVLNVTYEYTAFM